MAELGGTLAHENQLLRYLRTGTEGTFFLPGKNKEFRKIVNLLVTMVGENHGVEAVQLIKRVHNEKSYFKRDPLLNCLAITATRSEVPVKRAAYAIVNEVCENPYDLFTWLEFVKIHSKSTKGWGAGLRKVIHKWYHSRDPMQIAEFVTRYVNVGKWSHHDVFRLSHIKPENESLGFIIKVVCKGLAVAKEDLSEPSPDIQKLVVYFDTVDFVKHSEDDSAVARKFEKFGLKKEQIPVALYSSKEIWNSLLLDMSLQEILSSLPSLARRWLLTIPAKGQNIDSVVQQIQMRVIDKIKDASCIEREKISPYFLYVATRNYVRAFLEQKPSQNVQANNASSVSTPEKRKRMETKESGDVDWTQARKNANNALVRATSNNPSLYAALQTALIVALEKNLSTTGKRYLIAVNVSLSKFGTAILCCPSIYPLEVMALIAHFYKKKEKLVDLQYFTNKLQRLKYPNEMEDISTVIAQMATQIRNPVCDPAAPITWAMDNQKMYDVFLLLTDGNESHGKVSAFNKLVDYQRKMNLPDAKMVLCGLASRKLNFASGSTMLDIGGFDSTVPHIINKFVMGQLDI